MKPGTLGQRLGLQIWSRDRKLPGSARAGGAPVMPVLSRRGLLTASMFTALGLGADSGAVRPSVPTPARVSTARHSIKRHWNVRDFGATGDGETDDSAAIQSAIDAAQSGTTLYFPKGIYRMWNVQIDGKIRLTLHGPSAQLKLVDAPGPEPMIRIGNRASCERLSLAFGEIDGNNFAGGASCEPVRVHRATNFKFSGYVHHTWGHGLSFTTTPSRKVRIDMRANHIGIGYYADPAFTAFDGPNGCAIHFAASAPPVDTYIRIRGSDCKGAAFVYIGGCKRMVISNPVLKRTGWRGIMVASNAGPVEQLKILNPIIEDVGVIHESDVLEGDPRKGEGCNAIFIGHSPVTAHDAVIVGGTIKRTGENAVEGKCKIVGLNVDQAGFKWPGFGRDLAREAIFVHAGSVVSRCVITNSAHYGVSSFNTQDTGARPQLANMEITDNYISDAGLVGIRIQQSSTGSVRQVTVNGNTVVSTKGTARYGIYMAATEGATVTADSRVEDNTVIGTYRVASIFVQAPAVNMGNRIS
jgi:Pectate lyase superfamily protein/Right handed beta helix region